MNHTSTKDCQKLILKCARFKVLFNKWQEGKAKSWNTGEKTLQIKCWFYHPKSIMLCYFLNLNWCADTSVY